MIKITVNNWKKYAGKEVRFSDDGYDKVHSHKDVLLVAITDAAAIIRHKGAFVSQSSLCAYACCWIEEGES